MAVTRRLQRLHWRQITARAANVVLLVGIAPCGAQQLPSSGQAAGPGAALPSASGGRLVAQVLADIGTYYLEPVSARRVAIAGAARLTEFDSRLAVREVIAGGAVTLTYDDRS